MAVDVTALSTDEQLERNWREVFKEIALTGSEIRAVKYYGGKPIGYITNQETFSVTVKNLVPIKPKLTLREWTYDEIPVGQPVRRKNKTQVGIILHKRENGKTYAGPSIEISGIDGTWTPRGLLSDFDLVKTTGDYVSVSPCGVQING